MTSQLQRQVSLSFGTGGTGAGQIAIVGDTGIFSDGLIHLLLIPDVGASLYTDVGEARLGNSKQIDVQGGVLQFSGNDSGALPVPPDGQPPELRTLYAFDSKAQPTSASAHYDSSVSAVKLSRPCHAAVAYSAYKARAKTITYRPLVQSSPQGGSKTTYGVIAAYYQGATVIYPVAPPTLLVGNAVKELYRRYSYKVINGDGEFELPPNYPGSGAYPGKSLVIEVQGSEKWERTHEIGFLNSEGRADVFTPTVNILEPYVGDNYTPTIHCRISTLSPQEFTRDAIARATDFIRSRGLGCST